MNTKDYLKIHTHVFDSSYSSVSDESDRSSLDDTYYKYQPNPVAITQSTVIVKPANGQHRRENKDSWTGNIKSQDTGNDTSKKINPLGLSKRTNFPGIETTNSSSNLPQEDYHWQYEASTNMQPSGYENPLNFDESRKPLTSNSDPKYRFSEVFLRRKLNHAIHSTKRARKFISDRTRATTIPITQNLPQKSSSRLTAPKSSMSELLNSNGFTQISLIRRQTTIPSSFSNSNCLSSASKTQTHLLIQESRGVTAREGHQSIAKIYPPSSAIKQNRPSGQNVAGHQNRLIEQASGHNTRSGEVPKDHYSSSMGHGGKVSNGSLMQNEELPIRAALINDEPSSSGRSFNYCGNVNSRNQRLQSFNEPKTLEYSQVSKPLRVKHSRYANGGHIEDALEDYLLPLEDGISALLSDQDQETSKASDNSFYFLLLFSLLLLLIMILALICFHFNILICF